MQQRLGQNRQRSGSPANQRKSVNPGFSFFFKFLSYLLFSKIFIQSWSLSAYGRSHDRESRGEGYGGGVAFYYSSNIDQKMKYIELKL